VNHVVILAFFRSFYGRRWSVVAVKIDWGKHHPILSRRKTIKKQGKPFPGFPCFLAVFY